MGKEKFALVDKLKHNSILTKLKCTNIFEKIKIFSINEQQILIARRR
jgi:hypothetical protein